MERHASTFVYTSVHNSNVDLTIGHDKTFLKASFIQSNVSNVDLFITLLTTAETWCLQMKVHNRIDVVLLTDLYRSSCKMNVTLNQAYW